MNKHNLEANERFFDRGASHYDSGMVNFWMRRYYRPVLEDITAPGTVLDVSCGTGNLLDELSLRGHTGLCGVDYSLKMVEIAQRKLGVQTIVQRADVHDLPFEKDTFDYVVSTEAFHHYYDPQKAMSELARVTKRGGKVIVSDINPFFGPLHWLFQKIEPGCVKINTEEDLQRLFEDAGLQNIIQGRNSLFALKTVGVKL